MFNIKLTEGRKSDYPARVFLSFPKKIKGKARQQIFTIKTNTKNVDDYFVLYGNKNKISYVAHIVCTDESIRNLKYEIAVSEVKDKDFLLNACQMKGAKR